MLRLSVFFIFIMCTFLFSAFAGQSKGQPGEQCDVKATGAPEIPQIAKASIEKIVIRRPAGLDEQLAVLRENRNKFKSERNVRRYCRVAAGGEVTLEELIYNLEYLGLPPIELSYDALDCAGAGNGLLRMFIGGGICTTAYELFIYMDEKMGRELVVNILTKDRRVLGPDPIVSDKYFGGFLSSRCKELRKILNAYLENDKENAAVPGGH